MGKLWLCHWGLRLGLLGPLAWVDALVVATMYVNRIHIGLGNLVYWVLIIVSVFFVVNSLN